MNNYLNNHMNSNLNNYLNNHLHNHLNILNNHLINDYNNHLNIDCIAYLFHHFRYMRPCLQALQCALLSFRFRWMSRN